MSEWFEPGDVVICVDAGPSEEGYQPPELTEGARYTVFQVGKDLYGELGLFLDELESMGYAGGYLAYRFRKLSKAGQPVPSKMEAV